MLVSYEATTPADRAASVRSECSILLLQANKIIAILPGIRAPLTIYMYVLPLKDIRLCLLLQRKAPHQSELDSGWKVECCHDVYGVTICIEKT
jgi:hypothetical protein